MYLVVLLGWHGAGSLWALFAFPLLTAFIVYPPDVPASGMYFMTYEWLKNILTPEGKRSVKSHSHHFLNFPDTAD